jgi:hypothetical protein
METEIDFSSHERSWNRLRLSSTASSQSDAVPLWGPYRATATVSNFSEVVALLNWRSRFASQRGGERTKAWGGGQISYRFKIKKYVRNFWNVSRFGYTKFFFGPSSFWVTKITTWNSVSIGVAQVISIDSIVFWQWCITRRIKRFSDFVHRPDYKELEDRNTTFRKLDLFPSSGEGRHLLCWVP